MALTIFLLGIALVLLALGYDYWRGVHQSKNLSHTLVNRDHELQFLRETETQLKDQVATLEHKLKQTFADPVTDLLGWKLFEDRLRQAIKDSERHGFTLAVMMMDLDDFKIINEALGYEVGDALLKEVAFRLSETIRDVDNVSRFTKDAFVIMLTQLAKPETAALVAQRVLQSVSQPYLLNDQELYVTACVGISLFPLDGRDVLSLLRNADHALHLAKNKGVQQVQFYEEKMHEQSQRDLILVNSLSREESFRQISLNYQPVFNVHNQTVLCLEASLCWQHPELGMITMEELFTYADKHRKLNALSLWMLREACKQFLKLRKAGLKPAMLAIPLFPKQLENTHFVYELSQILQDLAFQPEWLMLELRNHFSSASFDVMDKAFNMLHYLNVNLAVDHFGADSLPLRYFRLIKILYLKLDSVLVAGIDESQQARALLKSIGYFSQMMSMQMIVSGVNETAQINALKSMGCFLMQGSALCEPLPADSLQDRLQETV